MAHAAVAAPLPVGARVRQRAHWTDHLATVAIVLVALVLLSIGLLALGSLQLDSLRSVRAAGVHSRALALGQEVLEQARADSSGAPDTSAWSARAARVLPSVSRVRSSTRG